MNTTATLGQNQAMKRARAAARRSTPPTLVARRIAQLAGSGSAGGPVAAARWKETRS